MNMSFYDGTLNRQKLIEIIKESDDIRYTFGYTWKHPTTCRKPITKEDAIRIAQKEGFLDADDKNGYLHLNAYSANDMF